MGVRVTTSLSVNPGGAGGNVHERNAANAKASGLGVTVMPDPMNFRPSWFHARDYGLLVADPFGRKSFSGEEESRIVIVPGETFRTRFGILVRGSDGAQASDLDAAYRDFLEVLTT